MNVIYEHKNELTFIGYHTEIAPEEGYRKCPEFWDKEYNEKSKRCLEKCGFVYHHTNKDIYWELMDDIRTEQITRLTKEDWRKIQ